MLLQCSPKQYFELSNNIRFHKNSYCINNLFVDLKGRKIVGGLD